MKLLQSLARRWGVRVGVFGSVFAAEEIAGEPAAPPGYEGLVDELSTHHVGGWISSRSQPAEPVDYEVVLADTGEVLARARADQFKWGLAEFHGFYTRLGRQLAEPELGKVAVRAEGSDQVLPLAGWLRTTYEPVMFVAMDIVDNCNLRCPFCLFDYANTRATHFMTEETIDAALRFLPYTTDGNFWFSCLHEPTLHPNLVSYLDKVPLEYRKKIFYTTNLAKRMPSRYFEWLANTGFHHINVSIESLKPALYERMRKGARYRIFKENWDQLVDAFKGGQAPPRLRYIAMAYKTNLQELPELVRFLLDERHATQVELRYTFDVPHIPPEFKRDEYLDTADWIWLRDQLAEYPPEKAQIIFPPRLHLPPPNTAGDAPAEPVAIAGEMTHPTSGQFLQGRYECRLSWDGSLQVNRHWAIPYGDAECEERLATTNVRDVSDPLSFLSQLPE